MQAAIEAIEVYLPETRLTTAELAAEFPEWSVEKIDAKTGISARPVAKREECASDLAVRAAQKLFDSEVCRAAHIDYLLLCTQTPDYFLPTTACLLQDRLGLPTSCGALDFNLGSSGFVYGLGLAQGLIATDQASQVLLLTADTYSKLIHPKDKSVRTIFGDAAAATLLRAREASGPFMGPFVYGTDGRGGLNLMVKTGGFRVPRSAETAAESEDASGNVRSADNLHMDGGEIFAFTLAAVPESIGALLRKASVTLDEVDYFVFHQPNRYMLEHLRKKLKIPEEKFSIALTDCGNTVSSTIPIALRRAMDVGRLRAGSLVMLVGFGCGYSWGATLVRWVGAV